MVKITSRYLGSDLKKKYLQNNVDINRSLLFFVSDKYKYIKKNCLQMLLRYKIILFKQITLTKNKQ